MNVNYYEILEIPSDADEREIKRAYHRLARDLHPDKAATTEEAHHCEERFAMISAAYNTLKDPAKRAEHDKRVQASGKNGAPSPNTTPLPRKTTAIASVLQAGRAVPSPQSPANATPAASESSSSPPRQSIGLTPQRISIAQKAFARGMQFFKESNFLKAIEFFDAAIQNNDTEAVYHSRLAISLIQAKKSANRAIDAAQRAIELDPYNLEHKFDLATIYETIGSKSNAQKIYEEIVRWDVGNTRALTALARLGKKRGAFSFAMAGADGNGSTTNGFLRQIFNRFKK
jgi:curved DNA-binding protein CbpA